MPTENRSSNTEISWSPAKPSAPGAYWVRGNGLEQDALIQIINDDGELRCNLHRPTTETDFGYGYAVSELSDDFEWLGPLRASPAPQPHPEPIAWMVGTAFWWTKEEAERDAAAIGLPVVGLGPMTGSAPAQQHQGEPIMLTAVATLVEDGDGGLEASWLLEGGTAELFAGMTLLVADNAPDLCSEDGSAQLYPHADPGEVERLRDELEIVKNNDLKWRGLREQEAEIENLRTQLAERDALLEDWHTANCTGEVNVSDKAYRIVTRTAAMLTGSAEPSAPVERDDATLIDALRTCEKWFVKHSPTAPLIGGFGDAEHPMLTYIRAALALKQ
ncbi:hypothetical protein ACLNBI_21500 [Pseudomonas guariconensis]|uniref:hypothetical protein n=1 Tax=Pseudomonas guariconensis TaxID=1288410 RepID=UPI0039E80F78